MLMRKTRNVADKWFNIIFGGVNYDKELKRMEERDAAAGMSNDYEKKE